MNLKEIAQRIQAHLTRIEEDPALNKNTKPDRKGLSDFYGASAWVAGRYVRVTYISYQGGSNIDKQTATEYLAALDAGFNGKHFRMP